MPRTVASRLSRRALLGTGLAAGAVLAGCSDETENPEDVGPSDTGISADDGPWRYVDGIGQRIELPERPTRIAAYGDAAVALMGFGITPVAIFHYVDPADDPLFDGLDLTGIPIVGTAYGDIELERLLTQIEPDLVVTTSYPGETPDTMYGFKGKEQLDRIREVAEVVGILQQGTAADVIAANQDLAGLLGVDVEGREVAAARADFEQAGTELTDAAARGLSVVAVFADETGLWYAKADDDPSLSYYQQLGVTYAEVPGKEYYWETVSWENADTIATDVVLYSQRTSYTPEQLLDEPVFAATPAAAADQLRPWTFTAMSYQSQTAYMRQLAGWLRDDRKVT